MAGTGIWESPLPGILTSLLRPIPEDHFLVKAFWVSDLLHSSLHGFWPVTLERFCLVLSPLSSSFLNLT